MKTVAEIAAEIGVSKQAIHKKIKRQPLSISLRQFTSTNGNMLTISDDGIILIKEAFNKKNHQPNDNRTSKESSNKNASFDGELIEILKENIVILHRELEIKNKQIEDLTATVKIQAESINAANKNELAETIIDGNKKLIGENKFKKRGGIFKIFSRKE